MKSPSNRQPRLTRLLALIRDRRISDVAAWIAAGHQLHQEGPKWSRWPLWRAVQSGVPDLVSLLLPAYPWPGDVLNRSLILAVKTGREDMARLLFDAGADHACIEFGDVPENSPKLMKLCIRHGIDPTRNYGFAQLLSNGSPPIIALWSALRADYPVLDHQASKALEMAVASDHQPDSPNVAAIARLVAAGVDPWIPSDEESMPAAQQAFYRGNPEVVRALGLRITKDQSVALLAMMSGFPKADCLSFLMPQLTPDDLNAGDGGRCPLLVETLRTRIRPTDEVLSSACELRRNAAATIGILIQHGARWDPSAREVDVVGELLVRLGKDHTAKVVSALAGSRHATDQSAAQALRRAVVRHIAKEKARSEDRARKNRGQA